MNRRRTVTLALAATGVVAMTSVAVADNVVNQVATGGGVGGMRTVDRGVEVAVPYRIHETGGTCDAADGTPVMVTINAPAEVTVSERTLTFDSCGEENSQEVTFSSMTAGTHLVRHHSTDMTGEYNDAPADF